MNCTFQDFQQTLHEHTTFCDDIINVIFEKIQANVPRHFKVGESYKASRHNMLTIDKLTKCFVVFSITRKGHVIDCRVYAKLRVNSMGHQCITNKYINLPVVARNP